MAGYDFRLMFDIRHRMEPLPILRDQTYVFTVKHYYISNGASQRKVRAVAFVEVDIPIELATANATLDGLDLQFQGQTL